MKVSYLGLLILAVIMSSCRTIRERPNEQDVAGSFHRVKSGETLANLAKRYRISEREIMETNGIANPKHLRSGQLLFMPDPDPIGAKIAWTTARREKHASGAKEKQTHDHPPRFSEPLVFPVRSGEIVYRFSKAKEHPYDGIGIKGALGAAVVAAQEGRVIFVGDDGTKFGLMIIVEHQVLPYITIYAHLKHATVKTGQLIKRGQPMGTVGTSGDVSQPHLHFQIRVNRQPQDPEKYLKKAH